MVPQGCSLPELSMLLQSLSLSCHPLAIDRLSSRHDFTKGSCLTPKKRCYFITPLRVSTVALDLEQQLVRREALLKL